MLLGAGGLLHFLKHPLCLRADGGDTRHVEVVRAGPAELQVGRAVEFLSRHLHNEVKLKGREHRSQGCLPSSDSDQPFLTSAMTMAAMIPATPMIEPIHSDRFAL